MASQETEELAAGESEPDGEGNGATQNTEGLNTGSLKDRLQSGGIADGQISQEVVKPPNSGLTTKNLTLEQRQQIIGAIPGEEVIGPGGGELVCPPGEEPVLLPAPVRVKHGEEAKSDDLQDAKVCGQFIMESGEWSIFLSSAIKKVLLIVSDICLVWEG